PVPLMAGSLSVKSGLRAGIEGPIGCLSRAQWDLMFPGHPDSYDNVVYTQRCGMDGFIFRTIVVRDAAGPVLAIPTFQARFDAASLADGAARSVLRALSRFLPAILRPRLVGVGFVECEWGGVGVRPGLDEPTAAQA